jgi:hypothetical protein
LLAELTRRAQCQPNFEAEVRELREDCNNL